MTLKKMILLFMLLLPGLSTLAQVDIKSPTATEFVRYQRIPVSYFNGLPSINIPLYTAKAKDLELPISLSYHASGIKVNQYPTYVGLGWNLNAGGCITRVINGEADETIERDLKDLMGMIPSGSEKENPGYYYSSHFLDRDDWTSEQNLEKHSRSYYELEPDEFVVNAYGASGSFYFYRDRQGKVHTKVKSSNGESFKVSVPVIDSIGTVKFHSQGVEKDLQSYRIYRLFYEFTIIKQDGTKLIFGGDNDCIEFVTEKRWDGSYFYFKTLPTSWMLREVVSPNGNKIKYSYQRNGNPIILTDVITDFLERDLNGNSINTPSEEFDRGKGFQVLHPVYPKEIVFDNDLVITFSIGKNVDLNTVPNKADTTFLRGVKGFGDGLQESTTVCYDNQDNSTNYKIPYAPHNYFCFLNSLTIKKGSGFNSAYYFYYTHNSSERLKLLRLEYRNALLEPEEYQFAYNSRKLPDYHSTMTDNWGFYNGKNHRDLPKNYFYEGRMSNEDCTQAETLTSISYPTGGKVDFTYELNDYSQIAHQIPDFKLETKSGQAGGLRIKQIAYKDAQTDSTFVHCFEYKNEDGTSSGILSGIPRYHAKGFVHADYTFSEWRGGVHFKGETSIAQGYEVWSEKYINPLGSTNGNHVTYSRVVEKIGKDNPLKKEYPLAELN